MSKRLYNYRFTFVPETKGNPKGFSPKEEGFNTRLTKPVTFVSFVYNVPSVGIARRLWKLTRMKELRRNGLRAPVSTPVKVERVSTKGNVR